MSSHFSSHPSCEDNMNFGKKSLLQAKKTYFLRFSIVIIYLSAFISAIVLYHNHIPLSFFFGGGEGGCLISARYLPDDFFLSSSFSSANLIADMRFLLPVHSRPSIHLERGQYTTINN